MEQLLDQIRTWRRHLHAIPEIGFQEYKTSKYLYEELKKMGYNGRRLIEKKYSTKKIAQDMYLLYNKTLKK